MGGNIRRQAKEETMAWYEIKYACGHTGREQIVGPVRDRQHRAEWIGNNKVCRSCWIKGRAEQDRKEALRRAGLLSEEEK